MTLLKLQDDSAGQGQVKGQVFGAGRGAAQSEAALDHSTAPDIAYVRPERDVFDHLAIINGDKTMTDTIDQDIELLGGVQAGMASKGFDSVWLNDDEMRVQHFHDALDDRIDSSEP